ncbi:MAG: prolyl oligopeptidase family serine peptidase [Acidobacteria bacterium]|nr:prolyl oligopeptidase family serine peptidase [Acidobacteriota bacterium]
MRRTTRIQLAALVILSLAPGSARVLTQSPSTPTLAPVKAADYGKWETLGVSVLADNAKWVGVPITRVDGTSELQVYPVPAATGSTPGKPWHKAAEGSAPAFSADGQWLAYRIGYSEAEREKMQDDKKPVRDRLGLVRLDAAAAPAAPIVVADITRFAFAPAGPYLAMLRYLPDGVKRKGADLLVRNLTTGAVMTFGNVSEFAWADEGRLLALAIDAEGKAGNGVHVYDPQTGALRLLDSGDATYIGLTWRAKSDDLAVFKSRTDDTRDEDTNTVLAWRGLQTPGETPARRYDHAADNGFPEDMRVVTFRRLQWSKDGKTLYFGIQEWDRKAAKDGADKAGDKAPKPKPAGVDVWHSKDERIIPMQRVDKSRDVERNYLSLWNVDSGKWLRIGTDKDERVSVVAGDRFATETDRKPYMFDNMFDRTRQDVYLVDLTTGARRKAIEGVWYFQGNSPAGNYLLYFKGDQYWTCDIRSGKATNITATIKAVWIDPDYDTPVRVQRPPSGVAGWLKDDAAVLLYDQHDIWRVAPEGAGGVRLTRGAEESVVHRYARTNRDEEFIDPASPIYTSLYGRWSKKFGYARVPTAPPAAGAVPAVERLVWLDKNVARLAKARKADAFAYVVQDFDDSPDLLVGGAALADATQLTATNTFQKSYTWGRSSLVDYKNAKGERLQGALYYPAGYEPGKKYPMIVYVYERLSQGVHGYVAPSERSPYNAAVFTANGYFVLQPDIVFRPRDPGLAAVDCVTAAVKAVLAAGAVDPKRVGLVGHSWGGYEASFIPTQTNIFAASIAGAPITNLLSFYGAIHWNQGLPEPAHFETGQARMDVPYWEDLQAYIRNSSTLFVNKLETPMMIFFGDKDGTVDFRQGVEMYNYARRAGKQLVMLVYAGENHSAREKPNQIDYHRRILQWFDHYLKGAAAPDWITKGTTVIDAEKAQKTGR